MSPPPPQNYALLRTAPSVATLLPHPLPSLSLHPSYILVRVHAIALNPTDWTTLDAPGAAGTVVGCDYAGVVEGVGEEVAKKWKKGDRIAGMGHGGNDADAQTGAFAKYIIVKGDVQMRIPDGVSFEEACTLGVGVNTTGFALYDVLGLAWPGKKAGSGKAEKEEEWVLIYGGSTATGSLAVQFAKLSGRKVVSTCSPRNFELVKERGADLVFDYNDPLVVQKIRTATSNRLTAIFDTVSLPSSLAICTEAMGSSGGTYCNLLNVQSPRSDIISVFFLGYQISGEDYIFEGEAEKGHLEKFEFGVRFVEVAERLWREGKIRNHPVRVEKGGLRGVIEGLELGRQGKIRGEKLVYLVEDTEWP